MANHIRHGKDKRGRRTAEELGHRETRLKKIRDAKRALEAGARENAAHRIAVEWDDGGTIRTGVYIPRRDSSSYLNVLAGGR